MTRATPIATSRLLAGGVLVGAVVFWMAWQRFGGRATAVEASTPRAADPYRASDIYLATLSIAGRAVTIGSPSVVATDGRDPSFTIDGKAMLFTSTRDDAERAELYRYDIPDRRLVRLTDSREMEGTPVPMLDGAHFTAARTQAEFTTAGSRRIPMVSATELWRFSLDGSDARRLVSTTWVIAAQRWLDDTTVAMIVGGPQNVLVVANVRNSKTDTILRGVSPSLAWSGSRHAFLLARTVDTSLMLTEVKWPSRAMRNLMALPSRSASFAELGDLAIVASSGSRLMCWQPSPGSWVDVADFPIPGINQLAVSPDGKWLALTASRPAFRPAAQETFEAFARSAATSGADAMYRLPASCSERE